MDAEAGGPTTMIPSIPFIEGPSPSPSPTFGRATTPSQHLKSPRLTTNIANRRRNRNSCSGAAIAEDDDDDDDETSNVSNGISPRMFTGAARVQSPAYSDSRRTPVNQDLESQGDSSAAATRSSTSKMETSAPRRGDFGTSARTDEGETGSHRRRVKARRNTAPFARFFNSRTPADVNVLFLAPPAPLI